ncbi:protein translocase subunit yidC [Nitrobacter winogradskyi Nb-255]|uniref:Membrane protein insertase YidC n=1 Tax=Nitrobacter winogradskyi (strain ATCC 25391 / DSM 10237 / CIP 104748 / NCIMB 11846 / Nb-255) TaxID=323098 RepID=Q3SN19_NITWN|nr:membrane protein insertase YidC [Nitrobacter winogradskyi]ABA06322.1 protein translocase subunit yidC [Nitrobacter winogradskyi Nb-255]
MSENRNTIIAIVLSALVLIAWQYFYNIPQMEKDRAAHQAQSELAKSQSKSQGEAAPNTAAPGQSAAGSAVVARDVAIASKPRVQINTPRLSGSISLTGARIDDLLLTKYRETVNPASPAIELFSPSGTASPYYAEFGWVPGTGSTVRVPDRSTLWQQEGAGALTPSTPVTLKYDNGEGLTFRRTVSVDDQYLFTIKDEVTNTGSAPVTLYPFALISRHGTPEISGYYILHEGLIGYLGDQKLQEYSYKNIDEAGSVTFNVTNGWLGITDKYWAAALLPDTSARLQARFSSDQAGAVRTYQTDYLEDARTIPAGGTGAVSTRLFAGAKEAGVVGLNFPLAELGGYNKQLGLNHFDLLIDWGWFYFITKPMFLALDFFFHVFGNFGVSILVVTVLIKLVFFPLANRSYASMAKMKAIQPQINALRELYPDDRMKLQQEMMEIYKKEKINPISGCLPVLLQIPVFFSLYKVLFVTIEMRHAPFFAWIKDLSAPDPTHIFNLFGLLPYDPSVVPLIGPYLAIGAWPIIMGVTMWFQMKLNPTPPDPTQKIIFDWMPVIFTFMLAAFPAGLVIYWAWNNTLSVIQQSYIMRRNGVKVELFDNVKSTFRRKSSDKPAKTT